MKKLFFFTIYFLLSASLSLAQVTVPSQIKEVSLSKKISRSWK